MKPTTSDINRHRPGTIRVPQDAATGLAVYSLTFRPVSSFRLIALTGPSRRRILLSLWMPTPLPSSLILLPEGEDGEEDALRLVKEYWPTWRSAPI